MKVLITGKTSYIGTNIKNWLEKCNFDVDIISLRDINVNELDFNRYDVLIHCAAVVHKKGKDVTEAEYYKVNSLMTLNTAKKAKECGIKHFIFFSSMSVYGIDKGIIDKNTKERPSTFYGKSKLEAENIIKKLEDDSFIISIIRPPMVYGYNCPGNYKRLSKFAVTFPIFPKVYNTRSMIYIENLCEFVRLLILQPVSGVFCPQNNEPVNTSKLVEAIAKIHNKKIILSRFLGILVLIFKCNLIEKVFSSLEYDTDMTAYENYCIVDFEESIKRTEKPYL